MPSCNADYMPTSTGSAFVRELKRRVAVGISHLGGSIPRLRSAVDSFGIAPPRGGDQLRNNWVRTLDRRRLPAASRFLPRPRLCSARTYARSIAVRKTAERTPRPPTPSLSPHPIHGNVRRFDGPRRYRGCARPNAESSRGRPSRRPKPYATSPARPAAVVLQRRTRRPGRAGSGPHRENVARELFAP
jgi:hypothetical protein